MAGFALLSCQGHETKITGPNAGFMRGHLGALVESGLRTPGSQGAAKARAYLEDTLKKYGLEVRLESFLASTPRGSVVMTNVIGRLPGPEADRLVLGTHWDTKAGMPEGFQGANDGASGCAVLLELARLAGLESWPFSIEFVFFDGEEAYVEFKGTDGLYGSREYVRRHTIDGDIDQVRAVLVVDMVGDKDLNFWNDTNSHKGLVRLIHRGAQEKGLTELLGVQSASMLDDHAPFLAAGIPAALLIDFEYGPKNKYWHTAEDTMDKISSQSLAATARLVMGTLDVLAREGFPEKK